MNLKKEKVEVIKIGEVKLDKEEEELLKLPPKFAVRKRLDSLSMEVDKEMCMAKVRYQLQKEDLVKEIIEGEEGGRGKRLKLSQEEETDLELMERLDAESRQIYDPIRRVFDHGKKRVTDLQENSKVTLPRPCDPHTESSIEMLKSIIMKFFNKYQSKYCTEKG